MHATFEEIILFIHSRREQNSRSKFLRSPLTAVQGHRTLGTPKDTADTARSPSTMRLPPPALSPGSPSKRKALLNPCFRRRTLFAVLLCGAMACGMVAVASMWMATGRAHEEFARLPDRHRQSHSKAAAEQEAAEILRRRRQLVSWRTNATKSLANALSASSMSGSMAVASPPAAVAIVQSQLQPTSADVPGRSCTARDSGQQIMVSPPRVDDDYCDCADGSDEPHTAACSSVMQDVRFECMRHVMANAHGQVSFHTIPLSRVFDGVCDCCDGADESAAVQCPNTCAIQEAAVAAVQNRRRKGLEARDAYAARVQHGPSLSSAARDAPHAAYRALEGLCLRSEAAEYIYELCLFHRATQKSGRSSHSHATTSLGSTWQWRRRGSQHVIGAHLSSFPGGSSSSSRDNKEPADDIVEAELLGGDMCVAVHFRRSMIVRFVCAADGDRLGAVSERSTCVYEVEVHTPAACS